MVDLTSIGAIVLAFVVTLLSAPCWIRKAFNAGLVGKDIQKKKQPKVAEMGGVIVLFGFIIGTLFYVAMLTFVLQDNSSVIAILAAITTVLMASTLGIIDDLLGWKIGLQQWQKPLLMIIAALPIVVINAGQSTMSVPWLGAINFGLWYPLLIVPLIIIITANGFNMLAGYNGLEAGLGVISLATLGIIAAVSGQISVSVLAFIMVAALLAFLVFNKYPAKVFPGDSLTYQVGALIGVIAILGNIEKALVILYIPYVIEFFLKLRGKFKKESFAKVLPDGRLTNRYSKWYGLEHVAVSIAKKMGMAREPVVVTLLFIMQLIFAAIALGVMI